MANEIGLTTTYKVKKTDNCDKAPSFSAVFRKKKAIKKKNTK